MARVGLDIDGVLADFHESFIAYAIANNWIGEEHRDHIPERWEFYLDLGLEKSDYAQIMKEGADSIFLNCEPIGDARQVVEGLVEDGHEIILVTNRYQSSEPATRSWLAISGILFDELHHVKDKTGIELDFFVDDKPENVEALNEAGVCAYLMDAEWNRAGNWRLDRVFTLSGYRSMVNHIIGVANDPSRLLQEHPRTGVIKRFLAGAARAFPEPITAEAITVNAVSGEVISTKGEVRTTSATGGEKGTKPAQFQSIPPAALLELASHYAKGAAKYSDHNFRKGYEWSKSYSALVRHLLAFWGGEDTDEETGSKHIIAVAWHALTLATFMDEHPAYDDRYKGPEAAA